ncbi:hypothetical protein [[Clostridium] polysaccharolyticum]|uniref:Uncharacterized protein n=1 Tax=[Clostridium] polysaccharolyticum TaxID=29364 RepID=A0A1H9Y3G0_9FIRM|nr:hypothetical protein [[Clostridium] polysaccharolyticum]SES63266.1 hypothetical protein SAMN04487772_101108 [[Clostridium] polysaccharolyticum]
MPINPIDVFTMPPKSQETSHLQKNSLDRAVNGEHVASQQFQDKVNRNMQKTVHAKDKEENGFRFDAKEKGQNEYQDNRRRRNGKTAPEEPKTRLPRMNGSSFDISI